MRLLPLATLFLVAAATTAAQQPRVPSPGGGAPAPGVGAPTSGTPTTGTARIRGRVVAADTGEPLAGARIMLSGPLLRMATTDDEGRYELGELPAGLFTMQASHPPYISRELGQQRDGGAGRRLAVADGEEVERADFALPRGGVITGRVTDEFGEPVVGAEIRIERYQHSAAGRQLSTFAAGSTAGPFQSTSDLGEYRIYGLSPGEYVISARVRGRASTSSPSAAADVEETFLPTYYPGASNAADATLVAVSADQQRVADFSVIPGRMARVSGTVHDSTGKPAVGLNVQLYFRTANSSGAIGPGVPVRPDASFMMGSVPPGDYELRVRQPGSGGPGVETASMPVTIGAEDLTGLRLTTKPGATIRGTVEFDGSAPRPNMLRVTTGSAIPSVGPLGEQTITYVDPLNGAVRDDGTFELGGIVGKVLLRVNAGISWTTRAVLADGTDITDSGAESESLGGDTRVRIVLTDKLTDLAGSVRTERGEPVHDFFLVVLPEEPLEGISAMRYTRVARPSQGGGFNIRNLPTGRYVAAAVEELEQGAEWDPAIQKVVRGSGQAFTLAEGQSLTLHLEVMR